MASGGARTVFPPFLPASQIWWLVGCSLSVSATNPPATMAAAVRVGPWFFQFWLEARPPNPWFGWRRRLAAAKEIHLAAATTPSLPNQFGRRPM
jgi:hypothetical protein